jgi:hypothetical protein
MEYATSQATASASTPLTPLVAALTKLSTSMIQTKLDILTLQQPIAKTKSINVTLD